MNSYLPFLPAQKWNAFLNFVRKNPLKSNIRECAFRGAVIKGTLIVTFLPDLFFLPIAEMGNWEVEEDDTLAVQDDDDEVRKKKSKKFCRI